MVRFCIHEDILYSKFQQLFRLTVVTDYPVYVFAMVTEVADHHMAECRIRSTEQDRPIPELIYARKHSYSA